MKRSPLKRSNNRRTSRPKPSAGFGLNGQVKEAGAFAPPICKDTLRFGFLGNSAASATYGETLFYGNSLFDPGVGSSSAQPVGFDQLAIWYARYRVLASKIRVVCSMASSSATPTATAIAARFVLYPSLTSSAAATFAEALSQPGAKAVSISNAEAKTLALSRTSLAALGFKGVNDGDSSALVTANPATVWYWHIGSISGGYTNVDTLIEVQVDYHSMFYERVTVPLSTLNVQMRLVRLALSKEAKRRVDIYTPKYIDSESLSTLQDVEKSTLRDIEEVPSRFGTCEIKSKNPLPIKNGKVDALPEDARVVSCRTASEDFLNSPLTIQKAAATSHTDPQSMRWVKVALDTKEGKAVFDALKPTPK